jgi:hypothetical protein
MTGKILIVGARGSVCRSVLEHFEARPDWVVVGLSRRKPDFTGRQVHWPRTHGENVLADKGQGPSEPPSAIREVMIVGVPAALGDEDVKAFIIPETGALTDSLRRQTSVRRVDGRIQDFHLLAL